VARQLLVLPLPLMLLVLLLQLALLQAARRGVGGSGAAPREAMLRPAPVTASCWGGAIMPAVVVVAAAASLVAQPACGVHVVCGRE